MAPTRVYVGGLPYGVRERDLERFFKGYGRTRDIMIKNGYGFVEFEDGRDADDAVYDLNGKEMMSDKYAKKVVVEPARGQAHEYRSGGGRGYGSGGRRISGNGDRYFGPAFSTEFRLIVKNLSSRVNWKELKDYMREAGDVTYADAHKPTQNEGVVEFATLGDMKRALDKLDDTEMYGRRIRLVEDRPKSGRSGRDRSRSSHSRSRSRSPQNKSSHNNKSSRRSSRTKSRTPAKDSRSRSSSSSRQSSVDEKRSAARSRSARDADRRSRSKSIVKSTKSEGDNTESEPPSGGADVNVVAEVAQVSECSAPAKRSRSRSDSVPPPAKDSNSVSPHINNNNNNNNNHNGASSPGSMGY